MKKGIILILTILVAFSIYAQEPKDSIVHNINSELTIAQRDSLMLSLMLSITKKLDEIDFKIYTAENQDRFKVYPTENLYILLRLDTQTGRVNIVQWSLDSDKEFSVKLISEDLSIEGSNFELYPTKNMYQFLLLDKTYGRLWHVQWGTESKKQWYRRIY